jgi:hypothetical protein
MKKAAVVIGVKKTGALPLLDSCIPDARLVSTWLTGEGFDVHLICDEQKAVTVADVFQEMEALITKKCDQLVVYFTGHGFLNNHSEFWMLSGAPQNANEAICLDENIEYARECGIANVVFIADTCRSTPQSLQVDRVRGGLIFPNASEASLISAEIDRYFATLPGNPAFEISLGESVPRHQGIFTGCFLQAYQQPDTGMIRRVEAEGQVLQVVPNRTLKDYLRREVPRVMLSKFIPFTQLPDARVESGENVYIGRAAKINYVPKGPGMTVRSLPDVRDRANLDLARVFEMTADVPAEVSEAIDAVPGQSGFNAYVNFIGKAQTTGPEHFETQTGFKVIGAGVSEVHGLHMPEEHGIAADGTAFVRLFPKTYDHDIDSVIIRLADGSGTVLAGIQGYIGTVMVEKGLVVNVSYTPSANSGRWPEYNAKRKKVEKLRAIVASAARFGVFSVDKENAARIASQIRMEKGVDPTLGLYAAYAYAEAGIRREVIDIMEYMSYDINAVLFDIAMLVGSSSYPSLSRLPVAPFCPMLAQGWNLLRVKRMKVPAAVVEASDYLLPALWTTFNPRGMDLILRAVREGRIS